MRGRGQMPAPRRRRRFLGWAVAILAAIVVFGGGFLFARSVYFLGTDDQGDVALYRGLPYRLPLGISLYSKQYSIPVQEGTLSEDRQRAVTGHTLRGKDDATGLVKDIKPRPTEGLPPPPPRRRQEEEVRGQQGPAGQEELSARTRELFALIPVALLVTAGFTAVLITNSDQLGNLSVFYGAYFLAVCVATHLVIRVRLPDADPFLFPLVALLAAFGLVMLYRLDSGLARDQANWFVLGLVLFSATIIFLRDYEALERYRYLIALAGIILLILPRFLGHAQRRLPGDNLGPITFQPTELAKICIVVFLASYLNERREVLVVGARKFIGLVLPPLKHLGPLLVVWGAAMVLLVFIRDLGSSVMFFGAFLALIYVATGRLSFVIIGLLLFVVGAWFFAHTAAHIQQRFDIWLDPFHDSSGSGYQLSQSIFAQADGGLFGRGLGDSLVQLPASH